MIVDIHAHALDQELLEEMCGFGSPVPMAVARDGSEGFVVEGYGRLDQLLYDLEGRLDSLSRRRVDLQLISPPPPLMSTPDRAANVAVARRLNASTAKLVAQSGGMLAGLAVVPLADPAVAADEIRRAIGEHGMVGVALGATAGPRPLDDPAFETMFAAIEDLDAMVFLHATTSPLSLSQRDFSMRTVVAWPTEVAVAAARLAFSGVLSRHPKLKLVLSHGGGVLASLLGRIDRAWSAPLYEANPACRANLPERPSDVLRRLSVDTCTCDPAALSFVIATFGAERVLFGTDFPYEIGDADGADALAVLGALAPDKRSAILGGNALRMLGRSASTT